MISEIYLRHQMAGQSDIHRSLGLSRQTSIEAMILRTQLHWTGHVIWINSSHIPHQLLYRVLVKGHRNQGHLNRKYKNSIKGSVKYIGIPAKVLEPCAQDRIVWHALTKRAFINIESLVPEIGERPKLLIQIQIQFPSSVTYAPDCVPSELDWTVTFELIDNKWHNHIWWSPIIIMYLCTKLLRGTLLGNFSTGVLQWPGSWTKLFLVIFPGSSSRGASLSTRELHKVPPGWFIKLPYGVFLESFL